MSVEKSCDRRNHLTLKDMCRIRREEVSVFSDELGCSSCRFYSLQNVGLLEDRACVMD